MSCPPPSPLPQGEGGQLFATPLIQAQVNYAALQRRRFHVPGHAGRAIVGDIPGLPTEVYEFDQTEVEGLDVLSVPETDGCLNLAQARAAETFGVATSFYLVNGASVGIQAAMLACLKPGDKVLLPRNVHRSVISGLILTGAEPVWFLPAYDADWGLWQGVKANQLKLDGIRAVILPSATYEGLRAEIREISALCRQHDVLLIADEAHGSLWPFSDQLPMSACETACDVVIHSLHKSAGSLTQTALAHLPHGSRMDAERFQQALNTLQTTSPSYLLMASLDATQKFLASNAGQDQIQRHLNRVQDCRKQLLSLSRFQLFDRSDDPTRVWLRLPSERGDVWGPRVEADRQIAYEATNEVGVLYVCGLGLQLDDYQALFEALQDEESSAPLNSSVRHSMALPVLPEIRLSPREAFFATGKRVSREDAIGKVSKETIVHCPPGIPVLMPGEVISAGHLDRLPESIEVVV